MQSRSPYYSHPGLLVSRGQTLSNSHPMMDHSKFSRGPESTSLWRYHHRSEENCFTGPPGLPPVRGKSFHWTTWSAYLDVISDISPPTDLVSQPRPPFFFFYIGTGKKFFFPSQYKRKKWRSGLRDYNRSPSTVIALTTRSDRHVHCPNSHNSTLWGE